MVASDSDDRLGSGGPGQGKAPSVVPPAEKPERPVDLHSGDLQIHLAETAEEIEASQRLRYRVFIEEMQAKASPEMEAAGREFDSFDPFCDHLLVIDRKLGSGAAGVIGTYRLMRRPQAARAGKFYTVDEFDLGAVLAHPGEILELGRSCVDKAYRTGAVMQFLWRGLTEYVLYYNVQVLFGCGSLHGTDPDALAPQLSYLHQNHLAPAEIRPRALDARYVAMDRLPPEGYDARRTLASLPPLIKGYLRLGGFVGDGAVVDYEFNTTDVCVVVLTDQVTQRYRSSLTRRAPADGQVEAGQVGAGQVEAAEPDAKEN